MLPAKMLQFLLTFLFHSPSGFFHCLPFSYSYLICAFQCHKCITCEQKAPFVDWAAEAKLYHVLLSPPPQPASNHAHRTGWTCKGSDRSLVLTRCNCTTRSVGRALEIESHLPLHKPKWHEYACCHRLKSYWDLKKKYFPLSGFSLAVPSFPVTGMLLQPFSKGFLGFFLMRAKDNLPITLLCNVFI